MKKIEQDTFEKGKRNRFSRLIRAKSDKDTIASWKSDLNRILLVFNVRSVAYVRSLLTVHSQTELVVNTHNTVSDVRRDFTKSQTVVSAIRNGVTNTKTAVSDVHQGVVTTQAIVSALQNNIADLRRTVVGDREEVDDKNLSVSITFDIFVAE